MDPITLVLKSDDPEVRTIEAGLIVLGQVDDEARTRVLSYLCARYGLDARPRGAA